MAKKTIGGFIATLRKANGMTQKDLAERLNVSDKTVSRWERDDGTPDLSAIPVIAEIFNITCDELLKGELKSPAERVEMAGVYEPSPRDEKQRQHLLKTTLSKYRSNTYIALGVSLAGMIVALTCNFAFLEAILGFFLGAAFFAASVICQMVFLNKAFCTVGDSGLDEEVLSNFKRKVIGLAEKSIGFSGASTGFIFPMVFVDAHLGLVSDSLLVLGTIGALVFLMIYSIVLYFINAVFLKKGVYSLSKHESAVYHHNHRLKLRCAIVLVMVLAATSIAHLFATSIWGPYSIMKGKAFEDYESFIEYMEQDIPEPQEYYFSNGEPSSEAMSVPYEVDEAVTYYDENGNPISEEQALTRRLEDMNGNVVCEYVDRNQSVVSIRYTPKDGTILPITVYTKEDLQEARRTANVRHGVFVAVYCIECIAILVVYFKKREK